MTEHERPPSCTTCGKPLPCVLHDRKIHEAILAREEEKPRMEMTKEWWVDTSVDVVGALKDGRILFRKHGLDVIFSLDLTRDHIDTFVTEASYAVPLSDTKIAAFDPHREIKFIDFSSDPPSEEIVDTLEKEQEVFGLVQLSDAAVVVQYVESSEREDPSGPGHVDDFYFSAVIEMRPDGTRERVLLPVGEGVMKNAGEGRALICNPYGQWWLYDHTSGITEPIRFEAEVPPDPYDFVVAGDRLVVSDSVMNRIVFLRLDDSKAYHEVESMERDKFRLERFSNSVVFGVGMEHGALLRIDLTGSEPKVTEVARVQNVFSFHPLADGSILIMTRNNKIQLWEIPEAKLRAYHERQAKAEETDIPALPDV